MPLADFDAFLAQMALPSCRIVDNSGFQNLGGIWPTLTTTPSSGAEQCDKNTPGALDIGWFRDGFAGTPYIAEVEASYALGTGTSGDRFCLLCDRLVQTQGLSFTAGAGVLQTTNLPTPALPRYSDGEGVMIGLQIWTSGVIANTVVAVSYTNQDGVPGRVTPEQVTAAATTPGRFFAMPALQAGDTGVRSVEGVALGATGSQAGNLGVVLFKPLFAFNSFLSGHGLGRMAYKNGVLGGGGSIVPFDPNACLDILHFNNTTGGSCFVEMAMRVMDVP